MKIKLNYKPLEITAKLILEGAPTDLAALTAGLKQHLQLTDEEVAAGALKVSGGAIEITATEGKQLFPLLKAASQYLASTGQISADNHAELVKSVNYCTFVLALDMDLTSTAIHTEGTPIAIKREHLYNQFKQPEKLKAFLLKMHRIGHFMGVATDGLAQKFQNPEGIELPFANKPAGETKDELQLISGAEHVRRHFEALLGPGHGKIISSIQAFDAWPEKIEVTAVHSCDAEAQAELSKFVIEGRKKLDEIWGSEDKISDKYEKVTELQEDYIRLLRKSAVGTLEADGTDPRLPKDPQGKNGKILHCENIREDARKVGIEVPDDHVFHVDDSQHNCTRSRQATRFTVIPSSDDPLDLRVIDVIEANICKLTPCLQEEQKLDKATTAAREDIALPPSDVVAAVRSTTGSPVGRSAPVTTTTVGDETKEKNAVMTDAVTRCIV